MGNVSQLFHDPYIGALFTIDDPTILRTKFLLGAQVAPLGTALAAATPCDEKIDELAKAWVCQIFVNGGPPCADVSNVCHVCDTTFGNRRRACQHLWGLGRMRRCVNENTRVEYQP